ncbi:dephospho-CoA kinase [Rubritalea squalenifaciens DSM 18772]|uniref:Dephospho-CoA kinase n=1 Tax=Rubritalea squalenifaciens DSM 18772 TaxID=1123071 RepID=A0A1M6LB27_9BACT|nr:dephospho-CoA kinase [Rubritalea squalenifaciens]SHJ68407.1 dephospho-CoA kinase [Rubritalea squalenifaciens DSM 18772]
MKKLGLTGGIATGKSTACEYFTQAGAVVFDCDACVWELYQCREVLDKVKALFGEGAVTEEGELNRPWMRKVVFGDERKKQKLQDLIHPMVRKECLARMAEAEHTSSASLFIADVPLLFEGGFDFGQDANLVVAVSRKTQVQRLIMRSGFDDATVHAILEAQLPISHKVKCADVVLWNEGPKFVLKSQIERFIEDLRS